MPIPYLLRLSIFCGCILIGCSLYGQITPEADSEAPAETASVLESLLREDVLELKLRTNFRKLIKEKYVEERLPGTLSYTDRMGAPVTWDIEVRTRGNQRKKVCYFPPLKIYFPKEELAARGYRKKFNDYKLVLSCKSNDRYGDFVLKEYLVYKLYSELTDASLRVQLVKLTIEDTRGKQKTLDTYGFLLENDEETAERLGGELLEPKLLSPKVVDQTSYDLMTIFQFMIGNADWYAYINHNLKIYRLPGYDQPVIVPYDFDYSGIVSTDYATPNANYPIENIRQRYFLGPCREPAEYEATLQYYRDKKADLLAVCPTFTHLSEKQRSIMQDYLESFFDILEDPNATRRLILEHCDKHVSATER